MFGWLKAKELPKEPAWEEPVEEFENPEALIDFFKDETGITFEKQGSVVRRKLAGFCRRRGFHSFAQCYDRITGDESLRQELVNCLTTNESFFYREFAQIEKLVLLAETASRPFTVLCAPCATGEEPYTIALALLEAGIPSSGFRITGIDINTEALERAREGSYRERSVRNIPPAVLARYFTETGEGLFVLEERVREQVTFQRMNVFDPAFPSLGKFDFVFSRNMLIYFDKETRKKARSILEGMGKDPSLPPFFGHADLF